jgi:hypothetical protein
MTKYIIEPDNLCTNQASRWDIIRLLQQNELTYDYG